MRNVSWEDIGGLENVKTELQEVLKLIYIPQLFVNIFKDLNIYIYSFFSLTCDDALGGW